jgi:hypothetical protein
MSARQDRYGATLTKEFKVGVNQLLTPAINNDDLAQLRDPRGSVDAKL